MQLTMAKPFDAKRVKQLLEHEDSYITDLFSKMPLPMCELAEQEEEEMNNGVGKKGKPTFKNDKNKRAQNFEMLHAKLEELKGQKKLDYKDKLLKKKVKNKLKKKSKKEERSMQKKLERTERLAGNHFVKKEEEAEENGGPRIPKPKPVFNSQGHMVFSKFDFSDIGKKRNKPTNDPKRALEEITKQKERLKKLEESGEREKADELREKDAWKSVLAKSSGEKVKDDPDLLKKSIKRLEQKKKHSSSKWDSRKEGVQKSINERQQKRQDNILKRKKEKKTNKLKKAAKKGRVIPGY